MLRQFCKNIYLRYWKVRDVINFRDIIYLKIFKIIKILE